ncbi:MAG: hypothetical protein ACREIQ_10970 [Nitrospiria bacterium]
MSETQASYSDITDLLHSAEVIPEGVESADYSDFLLLQPGVYENPSRTIRAKKDAAGQFTGTFEVTFSGGLFKEGQKIGGNRERTWVSSKLFSKEGRPGQTSGVAEYLKACGFAVKGLAGIELIELMIQSQNTPVGVGMVWTNRSERLADGTYGKDFAKTRDFNVGTKDEPQYQPEVEINGQKVQARHKPSYFTNLG